jgi:hypothetical protein
VLRSTRASAVNDDSAMLSSVAMLPYAGGGSGFCRFGVATADATRLGVHCAGCARGLPDLLRFTLAVARHTEVRADETEGGLLYRRSRVRNKFKGGKGLAHCSFASHLHQPTKYAP